jgi:cyclophilin family peptidyl-prolyl cis-trans isomerase
LAFGRWNSFSNVRESLDRTDPPIEPIRRSTDPLIDPERKKESLLKKHVIPAFALLGIAAALLVLAACSPVPDAPAATATAGPASATPVAPATQAVALTVQAPMSATVPAPVEGQRPLAAIPAAQRNDMFIGPAEQFTQPDTFYVATIVTDKGNIVAELFPDAVQGVNNFVTLALNGFYDGLTFHRVEPGFVIQGGDPLGQGNGGPGYTIPAEINHDHLKGALAWARTGDEVNPDRESSGSQFYVTLADTPFLDGNYSVFGMVTEGMDIAETIAIGDTIQRIDITTTTASTLPTPGPTRTPEPTPTPTVTPTPFAPTSQEGRPLATVEVAERNKYYNTAPSMTIDPAKTYVATMETDKGTIVIEMDAETAPVTVNNFVTLANLGFFDNMPVAHVEQGTYAVFGSPLSQPDSDVGYYLPNEPEVQPSSVVTGSVAMYPIPDMATQTYLASGSQFFIAFAAIPEGTVPINVFGTVTEGLDVAQQLAIGDIVKTITITEE